jgi:hypothetical protein
VLHSGRRERETSTFSINCWARAGRRNRYEASSKLVFTKTSFVHPGVRSRVDKLLLGDKPEDYEYLKNSRSTIDGVDDSMEWRHLKVKSH